MTSKELVLSTLEFRNTSGRVPREIWILPWSETHSADMVRRMREEFVWDIVEPDVEYATPCLRKGDPYAAGEYTDEWGCVFTNIHPGLIGEVKKPLVLGEEWEDADKVHIPEELLSFDIGQVNESCREKKDFFLRAVCAPRPFEQLQFIRGTTELYMDLMDPPEGMLAFMEKMHDFYCRQVGKWAQTEVDCIFFQDDWGSQRDLLISPELWEKYFMPMYKDYIDIAHRYGKKAFMHSDGHILRIIPKLIDLGLDALNSQLFCMGLENFAQYKGKLTFWGEIDRQYLIPHGTKEEIDSAVQLVYDTLWQDGGCIALCDFGAGANPENIHRIYEKWTELRAAPRAAQ